MAINQGNSMSLFKCFNTLPENKATLALQAVKAASATLDIDESIRAHKAWHKRLTHYVDQHEANLLDPELIADDQSCILGQWLYSDGQRHLANQPCFVNLQNLHQHFHREAARVVSMGQEQHDEEASAMLHDKLAQLSSEIYQQLTDIKTLQQQQDGHDERG
tara:strand:+ start:1558 stop:2043 length:486 start_codon:yes stop_codon:yes gene_type:complete